MYTGCNAGIGIQDTYRDRCQSNNKGAKSFTGARRNAQLAVLHGRRVEAMRQTNLNDIRQLGSNHVTTEYPKIENIYHRLSTQHTGNDIDATR